MPLISHSINFENLISQLLGTLHRKTVRIAWLKALHKPLEIIHLKFLTFTNARWEDVKYNGQTFVMEQMLIARFGAGITITNNLGSFDGLVIGAGADWSSSIGSGFDFDSSIGVSYTVAPFNFTVNVPSAITFVQSEMEAYIRKYKLFGTTFNIVIV